MQNVTIVSSPSYPDFVGCWLTGVDAQVEPYVLARTRTGRERWNGAAGEGWAPKDVREE